MKTLLIRIELDLQRVAAGNVVWVSESVSSDATDVPRYGRHDGRPSSWALPALFQVADALVCGAMRLVIDVLSGVGGYLLVGAGCIGPRELI